VKVLLDTHAVLWAAEGDRRLGNSAADLLKNIKPGEAVISDITLLEIAMLVKKQRIHLMVSTMLSGIIHRSRSLRKSLQSPWISICRNPTLSIESSWLRPNITPCPF